MVLSMIRKIVNFISNNVIAINKSVEKTISFSETAGNTYTYVTKVTRVTTEATGAVKGSVDFAEFNRSGWNLCFCLRSRRGY